MSPLLIAIQALPYFIIVGIALLLSMLGLWFYRSFGAGTGAFSVVFIVSTIAPNMGGLDLGVRVVPQDLLTVVVAFVTMLRLVFAPVSRIRAPGIYVFGGLLALNLLVGLTTNGTSAGVAARPEVYSFVALVYAMTFPGDRTQIAILMRALTFVAFALFALACLRWAAIALQIDALLPRSGSYQPEGHSKWRVIVSYEALILAQVAVAAWFFSSTQPTLRAWRFAAPVLLVCVAVLQHRSTWIACLAAIGVGWTLAVSRGRVGATRLYAGGLVLAAALVAAGGVAVGVGEAVRSDVGRSFKDAITLRGTAEERLGSWRQLVIQWWNDGPRSIAVGKPYGGGNERYTSDDFGARKISYQAHNYYVTVLTGMGLVGLAAYLFLWWQAIRGLFAATRDSGEGSEAALLLTLLAAQAVYYLTYGTDFLQALILGTALSFVSRRQRLSVGDPLHSASRQWTSRTASSPQNRY